MGLGWRGGKKEEGAAEVVAVRCWAGPGRKNKRRGKEEGARASGRSGPAGQN